MGEGRHPPIGKNVDFQTLVGTFTYSAPLKLQNLPNNIHREHYKFVSYRFFIFPGTTKH